MIDLLRTLFLFTAAVAIFWDHKYSYVYFGIWFLLTLISGVLDFPRLIQDLRKVPACFADFRNKRKAELPWIAAIVVVNIACLSAGFWRLEEVVGQAERHSIVSTLAIATIVMNLVLFGFMHWSLGITKSNRSG